MRSGRGRHRSLHAHLRRTGTGTMHARGALERPGVRLDGCDVREPVRPALGTLREQRPRRARVPRRLQRCAHSHLCSSASTALAPLPSSSLGTRTLHMFMQCTSPRFGSAYELSNYALSRTLPTRGEQDRGKCPAKGVHFNNTARVEAMG